MSEFTVEAKPTTRSTATAAAVALLSGETPKIYLVENEMVFEFSATAEPFFGKFMLAKKQIDRMKQEYGRTRK
jgi:hypothetical protein